MGCCGWAQLAPAAPSALRCGFRGLNLRLWRFDAHCALRIVSTADYRNPSPKGGPRRKKKEQKSGPIFGAKAKNGHQAKRAGCICRRSSIILVAHGPWLSKDQQNNCSSVCIGTASCKMVPRSSPLRSTPIAVETQRRGADRAAC